MRLKRSKIKTILVMAGSTIMNSAYVPVPKPRPSKEFISRVYARPTGEQRWQASEARKREILQKLNDTKKNIRVKAETYQVDRNTRITAITANQKLNIHSMMLMSDIANYKKL